MLADRALAATLHDYPDLKVKKIDVLAEPVRTWNDGIRMIPALRIQNNTLSGFLLSEDAIRDFIQKNRVDDV